MNSKDVAAAVRKITRQYCKSKGWKASRIYVRLRRYRTERDMIELGGDFGGYYADRAPINAELDPLLAQLRHNNPQCKITRI